MTLIPGDLLANRLDGLLHADTQVHGRCVDLTVARIAGLVGPGALDFGGSEYEAAGLEWLQPSKRDPDDDYGWWDLRAGAYVAEYNESLTPGADELLLLQPHPRLLRAGASHPTLAVGDDDSWPRILLQIGRGGCRLKENCRISRTMLLDGV